MPSEQLEITCKEYQPIGSIKLGLALCNENDGGDLKFNVVFISHYRPEMFGPEASSLQQHIESCQKHLFRFCCSYVRDHALSFAVITKTREPELQVAEKTYYTDLANNISLHFVYADKVEKELDSYSAGLSSDLVIHPGSTLGFELFAVGKKVIFGATLDPTLVNAWGVAHYVDSLPDDVKTEGELYPGRFSQTMR